jgi:retron-type reverse transcriptase
MYLSNSSLAVASSRSVGDDANFGYRRGRSTKDALRKVWKEIEAGGEWIVDADLKDFFGSVVHEKLLTLVAQRVSDGRVLRLSYSAIISFACGLILVKSVHTA